MISKSYSIFVSFVILFSIFSFGNNFDITAQEINPSYILENRIGKSYSATIFDTINISDQESKNIKNTFLPVSNSYSVSIQYIFSVMMIMFGHSFIYPIFHNLYSYTEYVRHLFHFLAVLTETAQSA